MTMIHVEMVAVMQIVVVYVVVAFEEENVASFVM